MKVFLLALLIAMAQSKPRTLVILENVLTKESHSTFLADLAAKGQEIVYKYATDSSMLVKKYGESLYSNIVILSPSVTAFGNGITANDFLTFLDDGGNIVVSANSEVGDPIKELASEVGIEIDEEGTCVIDHMNYDMSDVGYHDLVVADDFISAPVITGASPQAVLFKGVGMAADPENPLVIDILCASSTAYSHAPEQDILEYPLAIGSNLLLVAGMQARNNARIVFFGSHDMLSDKFYNSVVQAQSKTGEPEPAGNRAFVSGVVDWVLKRNGDLRFSNVKHNKVGEEPSDAAYRITDQVEYSIVIEEMRNGNWEAFRGSDVQLEFVRIDPFVRVYLTADAGGLFSVEFKVPDVYGVFKFMVDYNRVGYTHLSSVDQVSVRPFHHTEYERFIPSAYPYYASAFSMMAGLFVFSFVFLYHSDTPKVQKNE